MFYIGSADFVPYNLVRSYARCYERSNIKIIANRNEEGSLSDVKQIWKYANTENFKFRKSCAWIDSDHLATLDYQNTILAFKIEEFSREETDFGQVCQTD